MVGLGKMGANMVRRLLADGHECVVYDPDNVAVAELSAAGALPADSLESLAAALLPPRPVWIMVPDPVVDSVIDELVPNLAGQDIIIDGGNSYFVEDVRRAKTLADYGIAYVDVGTSGGVWGRERGYCLMIGGETEPVQRLEPVFKSLSPAHDLVPATKGRDETQSTAGNGYLHCGRNGAGHFVKMIHNGIEYAMMAAYSEGFAMLDKAANEGVETPLENTRVELSAAAGEIAEVWRRGSVVGSWLLDLAAASLQRDPDLEGFSGKVGDSGEGRWTVKTATDMGIPAHVLTAALFQRFSSRGEADYANRMLSALRYAFGGHLK